MVIYGIHCYGRKLEGKNERATVKGFLCEGVRFLLPMIFAVLASGVLLVPTALALIGRSSGESSGGSANAESLSVLLGSGNATKILKGLFFPQLRLSGVFYSPYGLGFGTLMLTVLVATMFRRRWSDSVMGVDHCHCRRRAGFCIHFKWGTLSEGQGTDPVNSAFLLYACHVFKEGEL